jgi:hypothetical protein
MNDTDISLFSEEERKEIAAKIETAAARGKAIPAGFPARGEALRRGLFPLAVNAAGALLLAAGFFCAAAFHRGEAAEIRESGAVLGITERRLIQEIRQETGRQIREKEAEIKAMNEKIAAVDAELARLDSLEALTSDQQAEMAELRVRQDDYRHSLAGLQNERARILADARRQEILLYAKLAEERTENQENQTARDELARLSSEQEKAALIEKQTGAYFSAALRQIRAGQYGEAAETSAALREFLNTPSFQAIRNVQARRESDLAAVSVLDTVAEVLGRRPSVTPPPPDNVELQQKGQVETAALQREAAEMREALSAQNAVVAELRARNDESQRIIAERERQMESLRAQNTAYARTIDTQQKTIATLNTELEKR